MAVDTQQILAEAEKLGTLIAQHPTVERYKQAQKSVSDDPEVSRTLAEFNRSLETLSRQEQSGMQVTDAQQGQLEALQQRVVSHFKVKALNLAQVDFVDLLRKVSQTYQKPLASETAPPQGAAPAGPRIALGPR